MSDRIAAPWRPCEGDEPPTGYPRSAAGSYALTSHREIVSIGGISRRWEKQLPALVTAGASNERDVRLQDPFGNKAQDARLASGRGKGFRVFDTRLIAGEWRAAGAHRRRSAAELQEPRAPTRYA